VLLLLMLQFLTPVFLPIPREDGTYSHLMGQHGLLVFMSSDGAVGGFNAYGERLWQVSRGEGKGEEGREAADKEQG
jgi:hypothetical protein